MDEVTNKQLAWQQAIDNHTEYLVEEAENSISDARMHEMRSLLKTSQLSNLQAVTLTTGSIAAIVNWIHYQMGRRETRRAWKQTGLGDDIINRIKQMKVQAETIARQVYGQATSEQVREIHVALVRLYVGYMRRWFVAKGGQE